VGLDTVFPDFVCKDVATKPSLNGDNYFTSKPGSYDTNLSNKTRLEYLGDAEGSDEAGTKQKHSVKKEAIHVTF
jgi:hypothetical protein